LRRSWANGQNPEAAGWAQGSNNVLTDLRTYQGVDGGLTYPGKKSEDAFTTSQVPAALMQVPYGAAVRFTGGRASPTTDCAAPNPDLQVRALTALRRLLPPWPLSRSQVAPRRSSQH